MITLANAIAAYPVLARLYEVRRQTDPEWLFRVQLQDGEVVALRGLRMWPNHSADQFGIYDETDAGCCRRNPSGQIVWLAHGTLADVIDKVLEELMPPTHPDAPGRAAGVVIGSAGRRFPAQRTGIAGSSLIVPLG